VLSTLLAFYIAALAATEVPSCSQPHLFARLDPNQTLVLSAPPKLIALAHSPIIISVIGTARYGKSTLMTILGNDLLPEHLRPHCNYSFGISDQPTTYTKGLWAWVLPETVLGRPVILVDSQGLDDLDDSTTEEGMQHLAALAVLMSDVTLFFVDRAINDNTISRLEQMMVFGNWTTKDISGFRMPACAFVLREDKLWPGRYNATLKESREDPQFVKAQLSRTGSNAATRSLILSTFPSITGFIMSTAPPEGNLSLLYLSAPIGNRRK